MVEERKRSILIAGGQLFAEKGYFSTTVQDIAEQCNMSKASIYKLFESKEDILLQIVKQMHEEILLAANRLHFEDHVSPKEQFTQKLVVQFQEFVLKHEFFLVLNQTMPLELSTQIRTAMLQFKRTMLNWQKEAILQAFGSKVEPIVWDLSLCMQGIVKEFMFLLRWNNNTVFELSALSEFVVESLEAMIQKHMHSVPLVTEQMAQQFDLSVPDVRQKYFGESEWRKAIRELNLSIHQRSPEPLRPDLIAATERLNTERKKVIPQTFMMEALIAYLQKREELQQEVAQLQHVYRATWEEKKYGEHLNTE